MVVPLLAEGFGRGITNIPHLGSIIKVVLSVGLLYVLKTYFGGATCKSERLMHGKVVIITVCPRFWVFCVILTVLGGHFWNWRKDSKRIGYTRRTDNSTDSP